MTTLFPEALAARTVGANLVDSICSVVHGFGSTNEVTRRCVNIPGHGSNLIGGPNMDVVSQTKRCFKCGEVKPETAFQIRKRRADGSAQRRRTCMRCLRDPAQEMARRLPGNAGLAFGAGKAFCVRSDGRVSRGPVDVRFWDKVNKSGPVPEHVPEIGQCWVWTGPKRRRGYGYMKADGSGRKLAAHRLSWELHNGPIQSGLLVCHRCDNPSCVRPEHLFLGTSKDNADDMVSKGRRAPVEVMVVLGRPCKTNKLTPELVSDLRARYVPYKVTVRMLAEEYGLKEQTVRGAIVGRSWAWVV